MDEGRARKLRFLALQLVGAVAMIHFAIGSAQLLELAVNGLLVTYLTEQVFTFPRTILFTLYGVAVFGGILAAAHGDLTLRHAYELGLVAMALSVLAWVGWHTVLDHGAVLGAAPGSQQTGHTHGGVLGTLYSHYLEPLLAVVGAAGSDTPGSGRLLLSIVSKTLELIALVVLGVLLRGDPRVVGESLFAPLRFD